MTDGRREPFRVRSLAGTVYLPNFFVEVGRGAVVPVIALLALDLGASTAVAGAIVALLGLGTLAFDLPAGVLVARLGEKRSMMLAVAGLGVAAGAIGLRPPLALYGALVFLMGGAWSIWLLARLAYATEASPIAHRGRVMSTIGGVSRTGQFLGPLIGAAVLFPLGLTGPFLAGALLALAALPALTKIAAPSRGAGRTGGATMRGVLREHRGTFGTAGMVAVAVQVLRSSRHAIIPLWGHRIGLGAGEISLLFGASSAVEIIAFYPVGILMDRKGRRWVAMPFISLLSAGIASIPLASTLTSLAAVSLLIGLANGLGAGFNMTLGSDLAPTEGRSHFLGLWRLVSDVGTVGGPLLVAAATSLASLGAAAVVVGGVGLVGASAMWLAVPETRRG